ncbi:hypothetical protein R3P38DRAFT_737982 [Favolaschia claudopus]|uniref:SAP domain-containing protein n=1 Tax=Favolaschia claudopus TaxID=2862362 RepID=A0AAW0C853_9AGAR
MSTSTSAAAQKFEGDINKYKVDKLKQLSAALGLTVTGSNGKKTPVKDDFLGAIKERVFKSSKNVLEADPRFAGLYEGKKRQPGRSKTSADKAAEDILEQSKPAPVISGALAKLQKMGVTADPKGQIRPLNSAASKKPAGASFSSPLTSDVEEDGKEEVVPSASDHEDDPDSQGEQETTAKHTEVIKRIVLLKVINAADPNAAVNETFVHGVNITKTTTTSGAIRHELDLREVVPIALANPNMSPVKNDRSGKISRPGFSEPNSKMVIGKIRDFVDDPQQESNAEESNEVDEEYRRTATRMNTLTVNEDEQNGFFSCGVFYEPTSNSSSRPGGSQVVPPPTSLTGAGSDRPKDIANNRHAVSAQSKPTPGPHTAQYHLFLRLLVRHEKTLTLVKNNTGADALANYRIFDPFLQLFAEFGTKSGYLVPHDYAGNDLLESNLPNWQDHLNTTFTQEHIILAAGLK